MLEFILYNPFFEILLMIPFSLNTITILLLDYKQLNENVKSNDSNDIVRKIKSIVLLAVTITTFFALFYLLSQYTLVIILLFFATISLIKSIINTSKDDNEFSLDTKYFNILSTIIFIFFFTSYVTPVYEIALQGVAHCYKEILLLLFINAKLLLFIYFLLINVFVIISNILELTKTYKLKNLNNLVTPININFNSKQYNFVLYNKEKCILNLIIDTLIYTLLALPTLLFNLLIFIFIKIYNCITRIIKRFVVTIDKYLRNRNLITRKSIYIAIAVALLLSYIIIVKNRQIFSNETKEIFNCISTAFLIPIIYDYIRNS